MSEQAETYAQPELDGTPQKVADWFHWVDLGAKTMADTLMMLSLMKRLPDHRLEPGDRETLQRASEIAWRLIQLQLGTVRMDAEIDAAIERFNKMADRAIKATERDKGRGISLA